MSEEVLSYSMEKKTERLLKLRKELDHKRSNLILPYGFIGMFGCYTAWSYQRFLDYALTTFTSYNVSISKLQLIDMTILTLLLFSGYFLFHSLGKYNRVNSSYQSLRKDIMNTINNEFCNCSKPCNCKDEYIKFMENQGIDLIF